MIEKWKLIGAMSIFGGSGSTSGATPGTADWAAGCTGVSGATIVPGPGGGAVAFLSFGSPKLALANGGGTGVYAFVFDQAAILGGPQFQAEAAQVGATFPSNVRGAAMPMVSFAGNTLDSDFTWNAFPIPIDAVNQVTPGGAEFFGATGPAGIAFPVFEGQFWTFQLFKGGVPADPVGHFTVALFTVGELGANI